MMDRLKMGMCVATMRFLLDYSTAPARRTRILRAKQQAGSVQ
ncbi:hypothetical protein T12_6823 [Trichinella patagoniensis]|uniref:Uncharacterized protein n=1 Tax=Trichinella patagoniensis TaxID=990121 RepID=A0A0V0V500_9BILA|nr:hypothetical protein T12_6823 [Trichinella patagoniensis]